MIGRRTIRAALINDTRPERHFGCYRVIDTIDRLCAANDIDIAVRVPVHQDWRDDGRAEAIAGCDLVIVNGEGTIHHDRPAGVRLVEVGAFARDRGIPAALINTSWHANAASLAGGVANFARVAVRETASARNLASAGVDAEVMPDLSIHFIEPTMGPRSGVVVVDSVLPTVGWTLSDLGRRLGAKPLNIFASGSWKVDLLHTARQSGIRSARGRDRWRALRTAVDLWAGRRRDQQEFEHALGETTLAITGRFHAAMVALALRTPVLAVESNTPKISATFADAGLRPERAVTDTSQLDGRMLDTLAQWQPDEVAALSDWLADGRRRQKRLFSDLRGLA